MTEEPMAMVTWQRVREPKDRCHHLCSGPSGAVGLDCDDRDFVTKGVTKAFLLLFENH